MPKVFISYRRDDTLAFTGRLHDKLAERFGSDQVFMDFDNIPLGSDFREHLEVSLKECDVLLAVIGPNWAGKVADANKNRLSDPADFVRLELQVALEREIPIIPVLAGSASMPAEEELPPELKPILYRQAAPVDMARDFHVHAERLMSGIKQITEPRPTQSEKRGLASRKAQLLKSLRSVLLIGEGSTRVTFCAWASIGIFTGILSTVFAYLVDSFESLFFTTIGPSILFATNIIIMGQYSTTLPLMRRRILDITIILVSCIFGCYTAFVLGFSLNQFSLVGIYLLDIIIYFSLPSILGATFVSASVLWVWNLGHFKWRYTSGILLSGLISGFLIYFVFEIINFYGHWGANFWVTFLSLFILWQTTVLSGMAVMIKLMIERQNST